MGKALATDSGLHGM